MTLIGAKNTEMNVDGLTMAEAEKKKQVLALASYEGIKYGVLSTVVAVAAAAVANKRSDRFRNMLNVSAKVSIPVMTGLAMFTFKYEMTVYDARIHPERFGIRVEDEQTNERIQKVIQHSKLPVHQQFMNYIYDHPFTIVAGLGVPLASTILYNQMHETHLTLSQKIMHSRVYAQGGVLSILLVTMAFRDYMDRHGKFVEQIINSDDATVKKEL